MSEYDALAQDSSTSACCPCEPAVEVEPAPVVEEIAPAPVEEYTPAPVEEVAPAPVEQYTPAPVEEVAPAPVEPYTPAPVEQYTPAPVEEYAAPPAEAIQQPQVQASTGSVDLIDAINAQNANASQGQSLVISGAPIAAPEQAGLADLANSSSANTGVSLSQNGLVIGPDPTPGVPLVTQNVDPLNVMLSHNAISSGAGLVVPADPYANSVVLSRSNVADRGFVNGFWRYVGPGTY